MSKRPLCNILALFVLACLLLCRNAHALDYFFTDGPSLSALKVTNPTYYAGFHAGTQNAVSQWITAGLGGDITVRVTLDVIDQPFAGLAGAGPNGGYVPYSDVQAKLPSVLPKDPPPVYTGASGQFVDASTLYLTAAQMEVLDVWDTAGAEMRRTQSHGLIVVSLANAMDFDPSDGINPGNFDFAGIMAHELGHIAGFISSGDAIVPGATGTFTPSLLDMFRFSSAGVRSLAPGVPAFYSSDGGVTMGTQFATDGALGGPQSSHWDGQIAGLAMNHSFWAGGHAYVHEADVAPFIATGWTGKGANVGAPEPGTGTLLMFLLLTLWAVRRREDG